MAHSILSNPCETKGFCPFHRPRRPKRAVTFSHAPRAFPETVGVVFFQRYAPLALQHFDTAWDDLSILSANTNADPPEQIPQLQPRRGMSPPDSFQPCRDDHTIDAGPQHFAFLFWERKWGQGSAHLFLFQFPEQSFWRVDRE